MQRSDIHDELAALVDTIYTFDFHHRFGDDKDEWLAGKVKEKAVRNKIKGVTDAEMQKFLKGCFYPGEQGKLRSKFTWLT